MLDGQIRSFLLSSSANDIAFAYVIFVHLITQHKLFWSEDLAHNSQVQLSFAAVDDGKITNFKPTNGASIGTETILELKLNLGMVLGRS